MLIVKRTTKVYLWINSRFSLNSSAAECDDKVDDDVNDPYYDDIVNFSDFELE